MDPVFVVAALTGWSVIGLGTGVWTVRRGHHPLWVLVAVALGPLFAPIAWERTERRPRMAAVGPDVGGGPDQESDGPRVLVGIDGSVESRRALDTALEVFGARCGGLVLAEVVSYDDADDQLHVGVDAALRRLHSAAGDARCSRVRVRCEVLAGPAGETLRRFVDEQGVDVVVVGRRGRGLTARVLSSVSSDLVHHSPVPVRVAGPVPARRHRAASRMPTPQRRPERAVW